jgi:hypothetical protein
MHIESCIKSYNFDGKMNHIYKKFNSNDIINTVLNILEHASNENTLNMELFMNAIVFVTDTIIFSDLSDGDKKVFKEKLIKFKYFEQIEKYLYSEYLNIKQIVTHSIGKISIRDNVKYLEKVFENYYNRNPLICSELLLELEWLESKKFQHYINLLNSNMDLINSMTLCIYLENCSNNIEVEKVFNNFKIKFNDIFTNKNIDFNNYAMKYSIMVQNIQNILFQKDWKNEEYIKSIIFYTKNYEKIFNGSKTDYNEIYNEIIKYGRTAYNRSVTASPLRRLGVQSARSVAALTPTPPSPTFERAVLLRKPLYARPNVSYSRNVM